MYSFHFYSVSPCPIFLLRKRREIFPKTGNMVFKVLSRDPASGLSTRDLITQLLQNFQLRNTKRYYYTSGSRTPSRTK